MIVKKWTGKKVHVKIQKVELINMAVMTKPGK